MRLAGAVTDGSGAVNEDGFGVIARGDRIKAAWVFDGVTGINGGNLLPAGSDARWLVEKAHGHLQELAASDTPLMDILTQLVDRLIDDWDTATAGMEMQSSYDPPAACLILVKRYDDGWQALRLGDSCLLVEAAGGGHQIVAASPNNAFDHWLANEAKRRRDAGVLDIKALLAEFRPQLIAARRKRNLPDGYSILEADRAALRMPEVMTLGWPRAMLLCTDGFYRAADHYNLYTDELLMKACGAPGGVEQVLAEVRSSERGDPNCIRYLRFKPADDATAVMLRETS